MNDLWWVVFDSLGCALKGQRPTSNGAEPAGSCLTSFLPALMGSPVTLLPVPVLSSCWGCCQIKVKGMVLYSTVSSPLDRSKRFTLSSPGRPVHSDTVLGFSWKHSSHAAIAQRLFTHISTSVYSQVLIYTAESTEASWSERKCPNFETVTTGIRTRALSIASPAFYQLS